MSILFSQKQDHWSFDELARRKGAEPRVFGLTLDQVDGKIRCYSYFLAALQRAAYMPISLSDELYERLVAFLDGFDARRAKPRELELLKWGAKKL